MKSKYMNFSLRLIALVLLTALQGQLSFAQGSDPGPVGCPLVLNPTITYYSNPEDCTVGIVADPGSDCLEIIDYKWVVNNEHAFVTGTSPLLLYESMDDIQELLLKVVATNGEVEFAQTEIFDLSDKTCANTSANSAPIESDKEGRRGPANAEVSAVYQGSTFNWVITLTSPIAQNIQYQEFDPVPGVLATEYPDCIATGTCTDIMCDFTLIPNSTFGSAGTVSFNGGALQPANLSEASFAIPAGTTVFTFTYKSCANPAYANGVAVWQNCFQFQPTGFFSGGISSSVPSDEACDEMRIVYGCPGGMEDGFCIPPEELEQDDELSSRLRIKKPFPGVQRMRGRIEYDINEIYNATVEMNSLFPSNYSITLDDSGMGYINFEISSSDPNDEVTLGSGGIGYPIEFKGLLTNGITANCLRIYLEDFYITTEIAGENKLWSDPGTFCVDFDSSDPPFESVVIEVDPLGTQCLGSGESVTLTANGPYNESSPNTTYLWGPGGETTPSISVNAPGTYTITVNDQYGCIRQNEVTFESCGEICDCETLDVTIDAELEGCEATFTLNLPNCSNASFLTFEWTFSNGNTYTGLNPPTQNFGGPVIYPAPEAAVKVTSVIDGEICERGFEKDITVLCWSPGFKMYPNPANDFLNLDLSETGIEKGSVEILNIQGLSLIKERFDRSRANTPQCDVSKLKAGVYFVRLLDEQGNLIEVQRLLVN